MFDDSLAGGFAGLRWARCVEMHALFDASTGHYVATRIEDKASALSSGCAAASARSTRRPRPSRSATP